MSKGPSDLLFIAAWQPHGFGESEGIAQIGTGGGNGCSSLPGH